MYHLSSYIAQPNLYGKGDVSLQSSYIAQTES